MSDRRSPEQISAGGVSPAYSARRGRRAIFIVAFVVLALVLIEAGSWVGLWIVKGGPFSWSAARGERERIAGMEIEIDEEGLAEAQGVTPTAETPFWNQINHPFLGSVYRPGSIPQEVSRYGFIGQPDPIQPRSEEKYLVAMLGGSVTQGFFIGEGRQGLETLVEGLSALPGVRGREVVVTNLAMAGYKQPQQLMALNYFLALGAEYDLVINLDGFNDAVVHLSENVRYGVSPYYPRTWAFKVQELSDPNQLRSIGMAEAVRVERRERAREFNESMLRLSPTANLLWELRDRELVRRLAEAEERYLEETPGDGSAELRGPVAGEFSVEETIEEI